MGFSLFRADADFCDFLRKVDKCVPYTMDKKNLRPFVGIVLEINGYKYYAPLTSPKEKHKTMKNQIDFLKIKGGVLGAINFNNMIPIHDSCLNIVELKIFPSDSVETRAYKNLLVNQLSWCNETVNANAIRKKAMRLYDIIVCNKAGDNLRNRCCNFKADEEQYHKYCKNLEKTLDEIS